MLCTGYLSNSFYLSQDGQNGIKLLKEQLELEDKIWNQINLMWGWILFFFAMEF